MNPSEINMVAKVKCVRRWPAAATTIPVAKNAIIILFMEDDYIVVGSTRYGTFCSRSPR